MNNETIKTEELIRETRRLCQRYIDEVVLPFSLCPWAAPALAAGRVQMSVITDQFSGSESYSAAASAVRRALCEVTNEEAELVLIVLPLCDYSRLEMDDLLRLVRSPKHDNDLEQSELSFALAAFHPDASPDTSTPERFIPYLRRTPDPMIQGVRLSTLTKIDPSRGSGTAYFDLENMDLAQLSEPSVEPLRLRVAKANLAAIEEKGIDSLRRRFDSIIEDRDKVRARLRGPNL